MSDASQKSSPNNPVGGAVKSRPGIPGSLCCKNFPIVYLNMPKSACTTIKNILYFVDNGVNYPDPIAIHADRNSLLKPHSQDRAGFLKALDNRKIAFTFVREPFARAYSAFTEKFFHEHAYAFPALRAILVNDYGAKFPVEGQVYGLTEHRKNFDIFLNFVLDSCGDTPTHRANPHWAPQSDVLDKYTRKLNVDLVGRVENFKLGMQYVLDFAKVEAPVDLDVRHNEGPKAPFTLKEVMADGIFNKLLKIYRVDVKRFRYWDAIEKYRG